jgi:hypothetical protein
VRQSRRKSASGFTFGELMSFFKKLPAEAEASEIIVWIIARGFM